MNPAEFDWEDTSHDVHEEGYQRVRQCLKLVHRPTGYYFEFADLDSTEHRWIFFSPGDNTLSDEKHSLGWQGQFTHLVLWLDSLRLETNAPDLWATISQERELVEAASSATEENRAFNQDELRYIGQQLTEIKEFLFKTQDLSESHRRFVEDRLDYLAEAAGRVGCVDWKNQLVGVLLGIAMQTALTSDATRELFRFAWTALGQLFGGTPALPH